jgi:hypothetical protein
MRGNVKETKKNEVSRRERLSQSTASVFRSVMTDKIH